MKNDQKKKTPKDTTIDTNIYYLCAWEYGNIQDYLAELIIITPETNYCIPLYYLYCLVSFFKTICFILCEHVTRKAHCFSVELQVFPPKYRTVQNVLYGIDNSTVGKFCSMDLYVQNTCTVQQVHHTAPEKITPYWKKSYICIYTGIP